MRLEIERARSGEYHMARDRELIDVVSATHEPVVRLYSWSPYAVSLGFNQSESAIDASKCAAEGIDVVRRPTGGRAVLHAEEITYAVITPLEGRTPQEWYAAIHTAIAEGLTGIGLNDAAFVKSQPKFAEVYRDTPGALCFSSSARYELEWEGRKFVGSAQRVFGDILLQHGSILLGRFHEQLPGLLAVADELREALSKALTSRAVSISEILNRTITFDDCVDPLATALSRSLEVGTLNRMSPELQTPAH